MTSLLQDVVRMGTGTRAMQLGRGDPRQTVPPTNYRRVFCGFGTGLVAVALDSFDNPTPRHNETARKPLADVDLLYGKV